MWILGAFSYLILDFLISTKCSIFSHARGRREGSVGLWAAMLVHTETSLQRLRGSAQNVVHTFMAST